MLAAILSLPAFLSGAIIVGGTIAGALATYFAARAMLGRTAGAETREMAGSVVFRVSALHGLILALVFAEELVNLNKVEQTVSHEAAVIADVFYDLKRYGDAETRDTRIDLAQYVASVTGEEWRLLAEERRLSDGAWARWVSAYEAILDLEPATVRQHELKRIMVEHIRQVPELRRAREIAATSGTNPFFMTAALVGVVLTSMSFFTFAPNAVNLLLLSAFGAYTGLVIFFIVVFSNPYLDPGAIEPLGFQRLFSGEVRELYEASKG